MLINMTIKRKWFDLIRIGEKKEEYRTYKCRQAMRLYNAVCERGRFPEESIAILRNGYNLGSAAVAVEITGLNLRSGDEAQHPEWGEPTDKELHMVIRIGKVLMVAPYHDVRDSFLTGGAK